MNEMWPCPPESNLDDFQLCDNVAYLISRTRATMWNMVTQQTLAVAGVTSMQATTLVMVNSGRCLTGTDLAREFAISASAVTRLIDRLERRGLLKRIRSEKDRRFSRVALTDEGQVLAQKIPTIFAEVFDSILTVLSEEEVGFLKGLLRRIILRSQDVAGKF
ncbi:MarR family transcriptional regulator [Paraburkholderia sp. IMGN_8]|uniref:MarR family winged helix-turn-helix transcriptional regulator n=1 Tax=Paraburkholderia sp. IMGN_8 TaxID=3136564 RepID=UPI0031011128